MQRVSPVVAAPWVASFFATISASKKSLYAAEQHRADVARARRRWIREQGLLDPARLVFIDETATSTNMVRLRGRCARGMRLVGYAPHGHWKTITFVAGLRHDRMVAPFVLDGPMNGPTFVEYVKQCLVPTLRRRDIVIMDNLPSHKVPGVREAIESVGATLSYLPPYSPISIRSSRHSAKSKRTCARPPSEQLTGSVVGSAKLLAPSARRNAQTFSLTQATCKRERDML
jgi:transposase